ncbi:VPS4-associated protein 1 [Plectosphaerella cucumerina]|uniref:VPS4-associated protein 1 n=1 Tax=Plectosphaerella cucumerina TaxID=40658 RepID=A0A8K0X5P5_9PEZI|nr:VPS4-associated protein 1 [Plectosphaerella cucumerina]
MSVVNSYTHRKVAETAAKGCDVCYRATSSVLVAPENKDFFYVCPSHLKDSNFCTPVIDKAAIEARKKKAMEEELERVKKEYEEKQKKKKEKEQEKEKEKDKDGDAKDKDKDKSKNSDKTKSSTDDKSDSEETPAPEEPEPRVFTLHKNFFAIRLEKKRQIELAKRNRERITQPNFFPSVPKGNLDAPPSKP